MVLAYFPQASIGNINSNTNFPPQSQGIGIPSNWFNTNFKRRVLISIVPAEVTGTHTDFPFLFNQTFADLENHMKAGGEDIRFVNTIGDTIFPVEIQFADEPNFDLIAWTKIPTLDGTTTFYMYYNNPGASAFPTPEDVWPTGGQNYVYHMNQSPATILDSTTNSQIEFGTRPTGVGKIGDATLFNGSTEITTFTSPTAGNATCGNLGWMSMWVKATGSLEIDQYVVMFNNNKWGTLLGFQDFNWNLFLYPAADITASEFPAVVDTFTKIDYVITTDAPFNKVQIYQDGVEIAASPIADINQAIRVGSVKLVFGGFGGGPSFVGIVDEFRFMDTVPSPSTISDRISTIYNNENNPTGFITIGPVETI